MRTKELSGYSRQYFKRQFQLLIIRHCLLPTGVRVYDGCQSVVLIPRDFLTSCYQTEIIGKRERYQGFRFNIGKVGIDFDG